MTVGGEPDFDFGGGPGAFTTWDGQPVSREPPHGASTVVLAESPAGWRVLVVHRARMGPDGDWAWTPPSGARLPGEEVAHCAQRELAEEVGMHERCSPVTASPTWATFGAVVAWGTPVLLDGTEHDRFAWLAPEQAVERCQPAVVSEAVEAVLVAFGVSVDRSLPAGRPHRSPAGRPLPGSLL